MDIPGKNKIVFKETINLSTQKSINLLAKLDKYVKMNTIGKIELDSKAFAALNKKATLTTEKLKHVSTPEVLVDSKKDTEGVVSNAVFDKDKETGQFAITNLSFKEGENFLTLETKSKLGKVLPVVATIVYNPSGVVAAIEPGWPKQPIGNHDHNINRCTRLSSHTGIPSLPQEKTRTP